MLPTTCPLGSPNSNSFLLTVLPASAHIVPSGCGSAAASTLFGTGTICSGLVPAEAAVADLAEVPLVPHAGSTMAADRSAMAAAARRRVTLAMALLSSARLEIRGDAGVASQATPAHHAAVTPGGRSAAQAPARRRRA